MLSKFLNLVILFFIINNFSYANTYRVFFIDKGPDDFFVGSQLYENTKKIHNDRCINRRLKTLSHENLFSIEDAPVYQPYIDEIKNYDLQIKLILRWHNYIVIECDSLIIPQLSKLNFVKKIDKTSSISILNKVNKSSSNNIVESIMSTNCGIFSYGFSFNQLAMLNIIDVHKFGITGKDIIIGMLDSGFNPEINQAFKNANIIAEYDFVKGDSITHNQNNDKSEQDNHGTLCFSVIAGLFENKMVGASPSSSFILAKTEDIGSETRIEEDNYAAAVEWMEAQGVDILSSSLGYSNLDTTDISYSYLDLDGKTAISSVSINDAVKRGVVCVCSAGNSGPAGKISAPADADSVIAVAAVEQLGSSIASFSSRGPRVDGVIKPDIAAQGSLVFGVNSIVQDEFSFNNGTSLSAPLITGSIGLILSAYPELKTYQIRELLYNNASHSSNPDTIWGHGIPDVWKIIKNFDIVISPISYFPFKDFLRVFVNVYSKYTVDSVTLNIKFENNINFDKIPFYKIKDNIYEADIPIGLFNGNNAEYYIIANDINSSRKYPYYYNDSLKILEESTKFACNFDISNIPEYSIQSQDCFVYPSVVDKNTNQIKALVKINSISDVDLKIYDLFGKEISTFYFANRYPSFLTHYFDVSLFSSGTYFLKVTTKYNTNIIPFIICR